jgi:hypothetical protein
MALSESGFLKTKIWTEERRFRMITVYLHIIKRSKGAMQAKACRPLLSFHAYTPRGEFSEIKPCLLIALVPGCATARYVAGLALVAVRLAV